MRIGALLAAALLAACGARTELRVDAAASGPGSGGAGGAGGAGGSGGGGGPPEGCVLRLVDPIASLDGGDGWHKRQPDLTYSSDDLRRVTLAAGWGLASLPDPPRELRHTSFHPWDDWPADGLLGPSYLADLDGGVSFAVAPAPGDLLALAFTRPDPGIWHSPGFIPESGSVPPVVEVDFAGERVLFQVAGPSRHLIGSESPRLPPNANGGFETTFTSAAASPIATAALSLGCSDAPASADAARFGSTWILALASGAPDPFMTCSTDTVPGPPTRVELHWMDEEMVNVGFGDAALAEAPVSRIQMAPHPDGGAWLAYTHASGGGSALLLGRVDLPGAFVTLPAVLIEPAAPIAFSADAMGEHLALAWSGELSSAIVVTLVDRDGVIVGGAEVPTGGPVAGAPSVLGRPDGRGLLVAWSEASPAGEGDQVKVARLECEGGGL